MKKRKAALFLCIENYKMKDDRGREVEGLAKYVGKINALDKDNYFEGAWFDDDGTCLGTVKFSKEDFVAQISSCKEIVE